MIERRRSIRRVSRVNERSFRTSERPAGYVTYEEDFARWSDQQASYINANDWAAVDVEHVADAIASLARSEKRQIKHRLTALLENLMKIEAQPEHIERRDWEASVDDQTRQIHDLFNESPSLREALHEYFEIALSRAIKKVAAAPASASKTRPVMTLQRWRERVDELIADA